MERQRRKQTAEDLEHTLGYRKRAKQLEAKLVEARSKQAELQAVADLAAKSYGEGALQLVRTLIS